MKIKMIKNSSKKEFSIEINEHFKFKIFSRYLFEIFLFLDF